jgi:hypothetical protein
MGIATYYIYSLSINLLALLNHVNIGFYFSIRTSPYFYPKGKKQSMALFPCLSSLKLVDVLPFRFQTILHTF